MVSQDNASDTHRESTSPSPARVLRAGGHEWHVREALYSPADRRTGTCLIFDAESVIRRVRDFPADWRTLPDAELYSISLGA